MAGMTGMPNEDLRAQSCRALARMREATSECFDRHFALTPRLDMLAQLYLAEREHRPLYAWSLCIASQVPASTAHRKIGELERHGLVACSRGAHSDISNDRSKRHGDNRYVRVSLTPEGRKKIGRLLDHFACIWNSAGPRDATGSLP
ncbi:MarR family transcriptional regulator [Novosphingobium sp. P6W]|uniref:MarR family transcriptional regulator n=1 Tax=Novosphingobium sp. P6W TaxID=1609758 RepID=UPI000ABDF5F9|nr:MarR family transcriptional regulator [Novosphingobium sp. P6W]